MTRHAMTEMRKAAWSGLDGRMVLRGDRKPRKVEPPQSKAEPKDEGAAEPSSAIAIDPAGD